MVFATGAGERRPTAYRRQPVFHQGGRARQVRHAGRHSRYIYVRRAVPVERRLRRVRERRMESQFPTHRAHCSQAGKLSDVVEQRQERAHYPSASH